MSLQPGDMKRRDTRDSVDAQLKEIDLIGAMTAKGRQKGRQGKTVHFLLCTAKTTVRYDGTAMMLSPRVLNTL